MVRMLAALWTMWVTAGAAVLAQAATSPSVPPDIFDQLSRDDWRQRQAAFNQLVRLGPDAEPLLSDLILRAPTFESRKDLDAALQRIIEDRLLGPSRITLHVANASPREVFDQISRQCFAPLAPDPPDLFEQRDWPRLTLDIDRQPFWQVMQKLSAQLGVRCVAGESGQLRIAKEAADLPHATSWGAFLVSAEVVSTRRRISVDLWLHPEPKITVVRMDGLRFESAVDENGNALIPQFGFRSLGASARSGTWRLFMTLRHPQQNPGTSIAHFQGRLLVAVQLRSQRWEIDQLQKMQPQARMMDGVPITASSFTAESGGDGYQLRATVPRAWTNRAFVEEVMACMRSKLRVVDGAGRALPLRDVSEHGLGDQISIEAEFARDPQGDGTSPTAPTKLLWDIPSETRSISIPVELSDLPISDYFR